MRESIHLSPIDPCSSYLQLPLARRAKCQFGNAEALRNEKKKMDHRYPNFSQFVFVYTVDETKRAHIPEITGSNTCFPSFRCLLRLSCRLLSLLLSLIAPIFVSVVLKFPLVNSFTLPMLSTNGMDVD